MKSKFARLRLAALVVIACMSSTAFAAYPDETFMLTWEAPTQNQDGSPLTDLQGYYIYVGETPETLEPMYFTGVESIRLGHWRSGTHYYAVSAVNTSGVESALGQPVEVID